MSTHSSPFGSTVIVATLLFGAVAGASCQSSDHRRVAVKNADCIVCHQAELDMATEPPHLGAFPEDCGFCHNQDVWMPADFFDHPWPLLGAHADATCLSCHVGTPPKYDGTPERCVACHQDDYDRAGAEVPNHATFQTECQHCHTSVAWTPATGGAHPENAFPIQNGPHKRYRNDCNSCHNPNLGSPVDGMNTDCVGCHAGEHTRAKMDPKHREVPNYPGPDAPPNFCLDCHPDGND